MNDFWVAASQLTLVLVLAFIAAIRFTRSTEAWGKQATAWRAIRNVLATVLLLVACSVIANSLSILGGLTEDSTLRRQFTVYVVLALLLTIAVDVTTPLLVSAVGPILLRPLAFLVLVPFRLLRLRARFYAKRIDRQVRTQRKEISGTIREIMSIRHDYVLAQHAAPHGYQARLAAGILRCDANLELMKRNFARAQALSLQVSGALDAFAADTRHERVRAVLNQLKMEMRDFDHLRPPAP